jgi:lipopolysaccharide/colanic/teichoic acid biosynthesis glycosyltransferase
MYPFVKRVMDISIAALLLLLLAPAMAIIAATLWATQRQILFRQKRPGLREEPFTIIKFCTMNEERDEFGALLPDAQRITSIGKFLRNTSVDEFPQLWNVLCGEMSLVGPRPLLIAYLPRYTPEQARRHEVKPGITGWAQVNGRNAIDWNKKFVLDVWYVDHRSLWLDCRILGMTILRFLHRTGVSSEGHATVPEFLGSKARD